MDNTEYKLSAPEKGEWTPNALAKWESRLNAEIEAYLAKPCPYYGPDLEFPIQKKSL
jgi:hypothetical protein